MSLHVEKSARSCSVCAIHRNRALRNDSIFAGITSSRRAGREEGTHELVLPPLPYRVAYRVKDQDIEVLHIFHARRITPEAAETGAVYWISWRR